MSQDDLIKKHKYEVYFIHPNAASKNFFGYPSKSEMAYFTMNRNWHTINFLFDTIFEPPVKNSITNWVYTEQHYK